MYAVAWFSAGSWTLMCINTAAKRNELLFITHLYKRGGIRDGLMLGRASPFVLLTDGASSGCVLHLCGALRLHKGVHWSRTWSTSASRAMELSRRSMLKEHPCLCRLPNWNLALNSDSWQSFAEDARCKNSSKENCIYSERKLPSTSSSEQLSSERWLKWSCIEKRLSNNTKYRNVFCYLGITKHSITL